MKKFLLAAALVALPVSVAHAMTVAVFLQKADALKARGLTAMFSSDLGLIKNEVRSSTAALRAEHEAARSAGRSPAFCPPPRGQASINSNEVLAYMRTIPAAQAQRMEVRDALRQYMVRRFPCR